MIPPQQGLPFSPRLPDLVEVGGFDSQRDQFLAFHDANPHVLGAVLDLARQMRAAGWERGSIGLIFERIRWLHAVRTRGSKYKLNNNFRAYYARLAMAVDPSLDGWFKLRRQPAEDGEWDPAPMAELWGRTSWEVSP